MPTTIDPITGHSQTLVTGIYIARGDDTLGPYTPAEAAALIASGYLQPTDHAARNGDAAWVPLAGFLPPDSVPGTEPPPAPPETVVQPAHEAHPHRWRRLSVAFAVFLTVPLVIAVGARWWEGRAATRTAVLPPPPPARMPAVVVPSLPVAEHPAPSPVQEEIGGPLRGSISLASPDGGRTAFAGVHVMAYPLAALETALAPTVAAAQAARERLDPQIEAAESERSARAADEQTTLQAWHEAAPNDPLRSSLRFAYTGARTATQTAEDNLRFLLDERTAAAGGDIYFRSLPGPAAVAETDAGGRFTLDLPADDTPFAVMVCARPAANDGTVHPRCWIVRLSPSQRSGREPLRLDDSYLTSSAATESLVHTAD